MSAEPVVTETDLLNSVSSPTSRSAGIVRPLLHRPVALLCIAFLVLLVGVAIVAPITLPDIAGQGAGNIFATREGPSWQHPLGTDSLGRDLFARLLVGTTPTVLGDFEFIAVVLVIGIPLGLAAGYFGGRLDGVLSWFTDLVFALPGIIIVLVVFTVYPSSLLAGMVTLGILVAPSMIRVVRSATLPVREELYIAAAKVSGLSRPYIVARHVLPRIKGPIIVQTSFYAASGIAVLAGLAFLGFGITPPAPSWGGMVNDGIASLEQQPWLIWPPGIAITISVIALVLLGDAVRDVTAESWSTPVQGARVRKHGSGDLAIETRPGSVTKHADLSGRPLLSINNLTVQFQSPAGAVRVVEDVSFDIDAGEVVGLVGESGCGKTVTGMSILGLLPGRGEVLAGRIFFAGRDLTLMPERALRRVRGREIGLISQEPTAGLNPVFRVGWQLADVLRCHHGLSRGEAKARAINLLRDVQLPEPELVARRYPHELSGGMAQRVAIARALAGDPKLLIADEPTTALDVTVQAEILDLLRDLQQRRAMAILLITHDWGVVADLCDRAVVMYAGQVVEQADLRSVVHEPLHPYTEALLASNPHIVAEAEELPIIPGGVPSPDAWPRGCHFHPRCPYATAQCREVAVPLYRPFPARETRCLHYDQLIHRHVSVPR